jgi:hypothetical protein
LLSTQCSPHTGATARYLMPAMHLCMGARLQDTTQPTRCQARPVSPCGNVRVTLGPEAAIGQKRTLALDLDVPGLAELQSSVMAACNLSPFHGSLQHTICHGTVIFLVYLQVSLRCSTFCPLTHRCRAIFLVSTRVCPSTMRFYEHTLRPR